MQPVRAYAAIAEDAPLVPHTIERRDPGPHDVLIAIRFAGICHSDIHTVRGEWGPIAYPQVVGHEIVGEVLQLGAEVTRFAIGDRVGVGCMVNSCRHCENCLAGMENYCLEGNTQTYASMDRDGTITQGGYSTHIVVDEDFVLRVPESIPYETVAPLLCAGVTTYSPLVHWGAGPGKRVAVIGMGGLGHLAVKLAHALGAEVTVLSSTLAKQQDGLRFGASDFFSISDRDSLKQLRNSFDLIVNTVSAPIDPGLYLGMLRLDGSLVNVGAPAEPMPVQVFKLLGGRRSFAGSMIGSIAETQEMLDFCAAHGVTAEVELIAADRINEAYERMLRSDVRYRFVIDASTFDTEPET